MVFLIQTCRAKSEHEVYEVEVIPTEGARDTPWASRSVQGRRDGSLPKVQEQDDEGELREVWQVLHL